MPPPRMPAYVPGYRFVIVGHPYDRVLAQKAMRVQQRRAEGRRGRAFDVALERALEDNAVALRALARKPAPSILDRFLTWRRP